MHTLNPSEIHPHFVPTVFPRHNRFLHAIMQANQAWFCVHDLGRLMGRPLDQRLTQKLDPDQRRYVWLLKNGKTFESLMVSESGMYALLVHHFVPENRNLRQWLSNEVVPALRESNAVGNIPSLSSLQMGRALGAPAALAGFGVGQVAGHAGSGAGAAAVSDHGHL